MYQLHDLSKNNSLVSFKFDDLTSLQEQAKQIKRKSKKCHLVILETKTQRIIKEYTK